MIYARLLAAAAAVLFAGWFGHHYASIKYEARDAARLRDIAELQARRAEKTIEVVTKYVDRVREVKVQGDSVIREVPIYVSQAADAQCVIPAGFVRIHDAAAGLPGPAGDAYAAPSGIALSTVAETIAVNYADCRANAEQLRALQDWANGQNVSQH
jgi:hypothetical protein